MATWLRAMVFLFVSLGTVPISNAQTQPAVEYFHAGWGYYFVTAFPGEIANLDGGAFGGAWQRTGQTYPVWSTEEAGTSPVCRFFSTSFSPRSSHFYTPLAAECDLLKHSPDWQYEAISFFLKTTDAAGNCPAGSAPLYRAYNQGIGGAPNHRYATTKTIVNQMVAQGWVPEGNGPDATFACLPPSVATSPAGLWTGSSDLGEVIRAIVLEDGTYYIVYTKPSIDVDAGVLQGTAIATEGSFSSSDTKDYPIAQAAETTGITRSATISGSYVAGSTLQLTVVGSKSARTVNANYVAQSGQAPRLVDVAGSYDGYSGHVDGRRPATFNVAADGALVGSNDVCSFRGTLTPRPGVAVFDWVVSAPFGCVFGNGPITGVAYYDVATQKLRAFATYDFRSDEFFLLGTKK